MNDGGLTYIEQRRLADLVMTRPQRARAMNYSSGFRTKLLPMHIAVLQHASNGDSDKAIAKKVERSERTIALYLAEIFNATGTRNRTQAVAHALRTGLIT